MSEAVLPDVEVLSWVRISISAAGESLSVHSESDKLTTRSSDGELRPCFAARWRLKGWARRPSSGCSSGGEDGPAVVRADCSLRKASNFSSFFANKMARRTSILGASGVWTAGACSSGVSRGALLSGFLARPCAVDYFDMIWNPASFNPTGVSPGALLSGFLTRHWAVDYCDMIWNPASFNPPPPPPVVGSSCGSRS